jgi:predicted RNase H-like nuclease (RuvC/YqgF family)
MGQRQGRNGDLAMEPLNFGNATVWSAVVIAIIVAGRQILLHLIPRRASPFEEMRHLVNELQEEVKGLRARIRELERHDAELRTELRLAEKKIDALTQENASLKRQLAAYLQTQKEPPHAE